MPKADGTYKLENIPNGEYLIKEKDTRNAETVLKVSVREGESKSLDITPENVAAPTGQIGFIVVRVFDTDGIPIPGCDIRFSSGQETPTLSSSQDGRMCFIGVPGIHEATIGYPGFKTINQHLDLIQTDKNGKAKGNPELRINLEREGT